MAENKVIYLKEALANKTPAEILDMMPFMVCVEKHWPKCFSTLDNSLVYDADIERDSYEVIGVSKEHLLLGTTIISENDDDFGFSPYVAHDGVMTLSLNALDNIKEKREEDASNRHRYKGWYEVRYVFCHDCTPKQREFLVKHCDYDEDDVISGYEAFHLIQETIKEWEKENGKKKSSSDRYTDYVQGRLETMDMEDFIESPLYFDEPH